MNPANHNHCYSQTQTTSVARQSNKVSIVFALTLITMAAEIAVGTWSGSMALLADGWHMGTHAAAFAIALYVYWYAQKNADNGEFSFGVGKVTYLGGFASAVALGVVALLMVVESIQRLFNPADIHFNEAIGVAIIGLLVNIVSAVILHDGHCHDHDHKQSGHSHQDHNLRAAYIHVLADALTSLLAIAALLIGKYFGLLWVDALMGIVGAVIIARWAYGLVASSSQVLLDKQDQSIAFADVEKILCEQKGVQLQDFHLWKISQQNSAAIISISGDQVKSHNHYKTLLQKQFPNLSHITVETNN